MCILIMMTAIVCSDRTQFSVLQAAWGTYVCYSSWSSSQFYVDILCCHHVHLYKYIYITIIQKNFKFTKQIFDIQCCSTYGYNWVHVWFLQFLAQFVYPALHTYFQHFPFRFYYFYHIFISPYIYLFHMMCYCMCYVCIFCTT